MPATHLTPRIVAAAALSVLAYLHLVLAPAYDTAGSLISQGILLRGLAAVTLVAAVAVLQFEHPVASLIGVCAACAALAVAAATGAWQAGAAAGVAVVATGFLTVSGAVRLRACLRVRTDLGAYVLDRLVPGERAAVDAHVLACTRCRDEVRELAPVAAFLGRADRDLVAALLDGRQSTTSEAPNTQCRATDVRGARP